jgi:hypothetical protein
MTTVKPRMRTPAAAKVTVQSSEAKPYDQTAGPALVEINIGETFAGDIDGESTVRALQVLRDDRSARFVSMQRFRRKLGGRQGTFVLQSSEIVENGKIKATWFVVPGSGQAIFPGCAARAALKATLEKDPTQRSVIGSHDVATIIDRGSPRDAAGNVIATNTLERCIA